MSKLVKIRKGAVISTIDGTSSLVETVDSDLIFNYLKIDRFRNHHHIYLNSDKYIFIFPSFYEELR